MAYVREFTDHFQESIRKRIDGQFPPKSFAYPKVSVSEPLPATSSGVKALRVFGRTPGFARLVEFSDLEELWITDVSEEQMRIVERLTSLRVLVMNFVHLKSPPQLASLVRLECLHCDHPNDAWLGPIGSLHSLRSLHLMSIRQLTDFSGLRQLRNLRELLLSGLRWKTGHVRSFQGLDQLGKLELLYGGNLRFGDGSLAPLRALTNLRYLDLDNAFAMEECAALATALPRATGKILAPFFQPPLPGCACTTCGSVFTVKNTGRPSRTLCPQCDEGKISKYRQEWAAAVAHIKKVSE